MNPRNRRNWTYLRFIVDVDSILLDGAVLVGVITFGVLFGVVDETVLINVFVTGLLVIPISIFIMIY